MSWGRRTVLAAIGASATALAGCTDSQDQPTPSDSLTVPPADATYAYTHVQASGNRALFGTGRVQDTRPVAIVVDGEPAWVLAFGDAANYWTVVTTDGMATTHRVRDGTSEIVENHGTVSMPPLAFMADDGVTFVDVPVDCAEHTHPVVIDEGLVYVASNGDLVIWRADSRTRLDVQAPVDARLVEVDTRRYALYGGQTNRYRHGALGDTTEGSSLVVADIVDDAVAVEVTLDSPTVFEGVSPLVADIDDDGDPELVTTIADSSDGARIRAYETDGTELATGPVYGPGWRHQLSVAPAGPDGVPELSVVRKPHVNRTAEFYRLDAGELAITATRQGYASHVYGSRNLDGGLAADFDSDGRTEFLLPTTDRQTLVALRRVQSGIERAWSLSLDGVLVTNVTGVSLENGRVAVGAGTVDGVRVWQG